MLTLLARLIARECSLRTTRSVVIPGWLVTAEPLAPALLLSSEKVTAAHRARDAYMDVRQSTRPTPSGCGPTGAHHVDTEAAQCGEEGAAAGAAALCPLREDHADRLPGPTGNTTAMSVPAPNGCMHASRRSKASALPDWIKRR